MSRARAWIVLGAAVVGATITFRLGLWQLDRAEQKTSRQQALDTRRAMPPLLPGELATDPAAAAAQHHRRIELKGRWLPDATVYLENRQMQGRPGFFVLTPLVLDDGSAIVVQRGWLPRDIRDRTRVESPPVAEGSVSIVGRIAPAPSRLYEFDAAASGSIRQNLDVAEYSREIRVPLRPLSLLQEGALGDGLQRDWPAPAAGVHKHYGYAFQWFALAALITGLYVWFQLIRPRRADRT